MTLTIHTIERDDWDRLLERFPDRTVFHTSAWLGALAAAQRSTPILAAARTAGGEIVAVWPALESRKAWLRILGSPLPGSSTAYMGPLFRPDADTEAALGAFLDHDLFRRYAYFACRVIDRSRPVDLGRFGFSPVRRFSTYWLDLTRDEEALWRSLKSECRSRIRRARRLGIEVVAETSADFVDEFWAMSLETFARAGCRPTYDASLVRELWERLHPQNRLIVLSARLHGERCAILFLPADEKALYYWGGASFGRHRPLPCHNLLHWEAILEARRRGLRGYDLISTGGGPGRFKRTFAPEVVEVATHWERTASPWLGALKRVYERWLRSRIGAPASEPAAA